jgi:hypothetical protein
LNNAVPLKGPSQARDHRKIRVFIDLPSSITDIMPSAPRICGDHAKKKVTDACFNEFSRIFANKAGNIMAAHCKLAKDSRLLDRGVRRNYQHDACPRQQAGFGAGCGAKSGVGHLV